MTGRLSAVLALGLSLAQPALAQQPPRLEAFSPQGTVKQVRQVRARFSEAMVSFGDPQAADPFEISCAVMGSGRWVDSRNWVYDFEQAVPAGAQCEFRLRAGLRTLAGGALGGTQRFAFSTGGPAIVSSDPREGFEHIDELQIFVLELDGEATEASIAEHVGFAVE